MNTMVLARPTVPCSKEHTGCSRVRPHPVMFLLIFALPQNFTRGELFSGPFSSCLSILSCCPHWLHFAFPLASLSRPF